MFIISNVICTNVMIYITYILSPYFYFNKTMYIIGYYVYKFRFFLWYIPYYNCFLIDFFIYELIDYINGYIILIISDLIVVLLIVKPLSYYLCYFTIISLKTVLLQLYIIAFDHVCYMYNCYIFNCKHSDITFLIFHS